MDKIQDEEEDDEEFNKDAIAHRLQQDVNEAKGRQYKCVAEQLKTASPPSGEPRLLRGHKLPITCVALTSDDKTIVSASKDGVVYKWDIETGAKKKLFPTEKHGPQIHCIAVSTDSKFVAFGGKDTLVHVYDLKADSLVHSFKGHRSQISCLAFRRNTHQLFSGSNDRTIKIWNLDEMCYVETLFGHQSEVQGITSLMRDRCVSVGRDRTLRMWKVVEESQLMFKGHKAAIDTVSMCSEEYYCTGGEDGSVCLWNVQKKKPTTTKHAAHGRDENDIPHWISSVAALTYTNLIASGSCDGNIKLWKCGNDNQGLEEIRQIKAPGFVNAMVFSSGGNFLVAGVGQEHRLGRWQRNGEAKNGILIVPVTDESLL